MNAKEFDLLESYRMRAVRAWEMFDSLHDKLFNQYGDKNLPQVVSEQDAAKAEAEAIRLQQAYFMQYYLTDDCTCKPDSAMACDVCQAQIKAKSIYREEM